MKNIFSIIFSWCLFFSLAFIMFESIYKISKDPYVPLKEARVPQQTKEFLENIFGKFGFNVKFVDHIDDKNWSNNHDYGLDSISGLIKTEDKNFVVYYDTSSSSEKERAGFILRFANENIQPLTDLFGKYFYPADVKGRKLPIYLANSEESFNRVYTKLSGVSSETQWMAGVCITTISSLGDILTNGIIIKDFGPSGEKEQCRLHLKHEMAHYTHLNNVNWLSTHPMAWESEGFAMYFENDKDYFQRQNLKVSGVLKNINLAEDVKNYLDSYWVGYSVMLCLSEKYSQDEAKAYIRSNYQLPASKNFEKNIRLTIRAFESKWKQYVVTKFN